MIEYLSRMVLLTKIHLMDREAERMTEELHGRTNILAMFIAEMQIIKYNKV